MMKKHPSHTHHHVPRHPFLRGLLGLFKLFGMKPAKVKRPPRKVFW
jgi:hypothetical protein